MKNNYNPIISSLHAMRDDESPMGTVTVTSQERTGIIPLYLMFLGIPLDQTNEFFLNMTVSTPNNIIYFEHMDLDFDINSIPSENMIDDSFFGSVMIIRTPSIPLPKNEYITVRMDLVKDSQVLSSKETTLFSN